jgi:hypothetical protein
MKMRPFDVEIDGGMGGLRFGCDKLESEVFYEPNHQVVITGKNHE